MFCPSFPMHMDITYQYNTMCSILYMVVPVYIAEISPKKLRGRLMAFNSIALTSGFLVCTCTDHQACVHTRYNLFCSQVGLVVNLICERFIFGWRISLSLQILIGSIVAFGMLFLPETPRYIANYSHTCSTPSAILHARYLNLAM